MLFPFLLHFLPFLLLPSLLMLCKKRNELSSSAATTPKRKKPELSTPPTATSQPKSAEKIRPQERTPPLAKEGKKTKEEVAEGEEELPTAVEKKKKPLSKEEIKRWTKVKRKRKWDEKIRAQRYDKSADEVVNAIIRKGLRKEQQRMAEQHRNEMMQKMQTERVGDKAAPWMRIPSPYNSTFTFVKTKAEYLAMTKSKRETFREEMEKEIDRRFSHQRIVSSAHFQFKVACYREHVARDGQQNFSMDKILPYIAGNPVYGRFVKWLEAVYLLSLQDKCERDRDHLYGDILQEIREELVQYEEHLSPTFQRRIPKIKVEIKAKKMEDELGYTQDSITEIESEGTQSDELEEIRKEESVQKDKRKKPSKQTSKIAKTPQDGQQKTASSMQTVTKTAYLSVKR